MKIITTNLNGIRSAANKGFFTRMLAQKADIVRVQELKAQAADMAPAMSVPRGYHGYFHYTEKKGYSGVGIYAVVSNQSQTLPLQCRRPADPVSRLAHLSAGEAQPSRASQCPSISAT